MVAITKNKERSKVSDEYGTPKWLFDVLHNEFDFHLDVCASAKNYKYPIYYDQMNDGLDLSNPWHDVNWCNPPYSCQLPWLQRAEREVCKDNGFTTVILQKYDPSTRHGKLAYYGADEIRIIENRIKFQGAELSANFPCCITIFRPRLYTRKTPAHIVNVNYSELM